MSGSQLIVILGIANLNSIILVYIAENYCLSSKFTFTLPWCLLCLADSCLSRDDVYKPSLVSLYPEVAIGPVLIYEISGQGFLEAYRLSLLSLSLF